MLPTMRLSILLSMFVLATMLGLALLSSAPFTQPVFADEPAAESAVGSLFIPSIQNGNRGGGTETPTPPPPPPPPPASSAFFADMQWRTSSASLATDAKGGTHVAYVFYHGLAENVPNAGVYEFCASECDKAAQWQRVRLGEQVNEIQVAVTSQGRPRILYRTHASNNGWHFYYGECNEQCTDAARWTLTKIGENEGMAPLEISDGELPQRYFTLDNEGRPRFIYNDRAPMHYGTYYRFCDQNCTDMNNWQEVRINKDNGNSGPYRDEDLFYPVLTFSSANQPRVVADGVTMQDEFFLYYVACDASCDNAANWQSAPLFARGHGFEFSYDLDINAEGDPRIAFYEGAHVNGGGNRLSYAWCNDNCTQGANWGRRELGLQTLDGQEPDLELDTAGRPHIAYTLYNAGGLGYSTCRASCEGADAQWKHEILEDRTKLRQEWSITHPLICSNGLWDGVTPSLSLDAKGNPHIAYDVTYYARCHYVGEDKWEPWTEMNLVWRAVRVRLANRGAVPGDATATPTATVTGQPTETSTATPTATATATTTPTPPPPARLGKGLFPETQWFTSSSDVAVDQNDGQHLAYVFTEVLFGPDPHGTNNPTAAIYRFCQSNCEVAQNWSSVTLSEGVSEVQLGLTPGGLPRLLLLVRAQESYGHADRYVYAECDANCTSIGGWTLTPVVTVPNDLSWHWIDDPDNMDDVWREKQPRRYFALDPAGRPRFVYAHYNQEVDAAGVGAYYAHCDADCTTPDNWKQTRITEVTNWSGTLEWEILEDPVLLFDADGFPRILATVLPLGILRFPGLYYIACDIECDNGSNWLKAQVGNGDDANAFYDMALDGAGRPFVVLSYWWQDAFRTAWCDGACVEWTNWQVADGPMLDMELTAVEMNAQGQPRIVYTTTEFDQSGNNEDRSLYYLWCDTNCRSTEAVWEHVRIESSENVRAEWTMNIPPACAKGEWYQLVPSLALNGAGIAHVAVDMAYIGPCQFDPTGGWTPGENHAYSNVWRVARLATFPEP